MNSVRSGGRAGGDEVLGQIEVGDLAEDALGGVELAELDQPSRLVTGLLRQFALGGLLQRLVVRGSLRSASPSRNP